MAYNVLIVDDSATMRALIRKVLVISGFNIGQFFEAGNGREALDILARQWVDIILSDLHMPEMDGLALMQAIRNNKLWRHLPVVLITTEARSDIIDQIQPHLAQGYINKPFRPEVLKQKLIGILGENCGTTAVQLEGSDF